MNRTLILAALALLSVSIPLQARAAPDIPPVPEPIIQAASLYDSAGYDAMANEMASATASLEAFAIKYQAPPFLPGDTVNNGLKANAIRSDSKTYLVIGSSIIGIGDGHDGPPAIIGAGADSKSIMTHIINSGIVDDDPAANVAAIGRNA